MTDVPVYVTDTSVVGRWRLANPPYVEDAFAICDDFVAGHINLTG
jgi:hypothetical protein